VIVADDSLGDETAMDLLPFAPGVPVILITGVGDEQIAARAFTAGISDSLVKDIGRNYLEQLPEGTTPDRLIIERKQLAEQRHLCRHSAKRCCLSWRVLR
jgi:PleD family two-component response regulator